MFYIHEQPKGTPVKVNGVMLGYTPITEYWVVGCKTTVEERQDGSGYGSMRTIKDWRSNLRHNSVDSFIKQVQAIIKLKDFTITHKLFY